MWQDYYQASLNHPCAYCKCLELDDAKLGGRVVVDSSGKSRVFFGQSPDPVGESFKDYYPPADVPEERVVDYYWLAEVNLGYDRQDIFPNLSSLAKTARQGSEFCAMLRQDLLAVWLNERDLDNVRARVACRAGLFGHHFPRWTRWYHKITKGNKTFSSITRMANREHAEVVTADNESHPDGTIAIYEIVCEYHQFIWTHQEDLPWRFFEENGVPWLDNLSVKFKIFDRSAHHGYHMGSLIYKVSTDSSDKCSDWLNIWRRPVVQEGACLERLNHLLEEAARHVPPPEENLYLPTRLIDVGSRSQPILRLIISKDHRPFLETVDPMAKRYVALSYCWGSMEDAKKQLKTTCDTLNDHLDHLQHEKLPRTIADAVELCRALNIRYLWVDALCIIQGDSEDWARESFEMSNIYANSLWTVCVLRGSSCLDGFLKPRNVNPRLTVSFRSALDTSVSGKYYLTVHDYHFPGRWYADKDEPFLEELKSSAWDKRGWTFQEGHLSKRIIHFGDRMFHVNCPEVHESEDGSQFRYHPTTQRISQPTGPNRNNSLNNWYGWVGEYTQRNLTVTGDKLPAISAIARKLYSFLPGGRYLAGLWEVDFQRGLLWTAGSTRRLALEYIQGIKEDYIAPSWSWACQPHKPSWIWEDGRCHSFTREFELRDVKLETDPSNPYGRISGGHILLNAKLFRIPLDRSGWYGFKRKGPIAGNSTPYFREELYSEERDYITYFTFDWSNDLVKPRDAQDQVWMVWIASAEIDHDRGDEKGDLRDHEITVGLLLIPNENGDGFLKVGLFSSMNRGLGGKKFWDHIQPCEVKLV